MGNIEIIAGMEPMSLLLLTGKNISQVDFSIQDLVLSVNGFSDLELQKAYELYLPQFLKAAFSEARHSINKFAEETRELLVVGTTQMQRDGWNIKAQSAIRINAGNELPFDRANIQTEANERGFGESVEDLALKIQEKHAALGKLESIISGFQSKALKIVDGLEEKSDLDSLESSIEALRKEAEEKIKYRMTL